MMYYTNCNQHYGKSNDELMTSYIQSASEIVKSVNSLAVFILETYKEYNLSLKKYTFMGTTSVGNKDKIGECIILLYFRVEIPKTTQLSVIQQHPICLFNNILTQENNLFTCLGEVLSSQAEVINYLHLYANNGNMANLEYAKNKKRTVQSNIENVKLYMKELNILYKEIKDKKWM